MSWEGVYKKSEISRVGVTVNSSVYTCGSFSHPSGKQSMVGRFSEGSWQVAWRCLFNPKKIASPWHKCLIFRWLWQGPIHLNGSLLVVVLPSKCNKVCNLCYSHGATHHFHDTCTTLSSCLFTLWGQSRDDKKKNMAQLSIFTAPPSTSINKVLHCCSLLMSQLY